MCLTAALAACPQMCGEIANSQLRTKMMPQMVHCSVPFHIHNASQSGVPGVHDWRETGSSSGHKSHFVAATKLSITQYTEVGPNLCR